MNLPQNIINGNQMFSNFSTILENTSSVGKKEDMTKPTGKHITFEQENESIVFNYTSLSGEKFQVEQIEDNLFGKDCALLNTKKALFLKYGDEKMADLSKKISDIEGITTVTFSNKYQVHLRKGKLFEWSEVAEQIFLLLDSTIKPPLDSTIKPHKDEVFEYILNTGEKVELVECNNGYNKDFAYLNSSFALPISNESPLFTAMKAIKGIVSVRSHDQYRIYINKGTLFQWKDIAEQIFLLLEKSQVNLKNTFEQRYL
jgi:hypothetical protein